ncbi:MAG: AGE family epimerase/isomerase [Desulfobacterota bacterium]|nr:AGE family epimerase/isomerase [Thermodesulfobacteriota bacterium]
MGFLDELFEDKDCGGLFHSMSEDFTTVRDARKCAHDQFIAARTTVIGAMLTHDHAAIAEAEAAVTQVIERFEDTHYGGYFSAADRQWNIIDKTKQLICTGELFGCLMHLYEVSKNDAHLLTALDFLDLALEQAWDPVRGGFFSVYYDNWKPALDIKDLATQASMLQHLDGSWKDGMDSPYGARSMYHRKQAEHFANLLIEHCADKQHGGFYTHCTSDWKPATPSKDVGALADFALALYFHYHTLGPSIWGPRKGSHAYTGKPYPGAYTYRGPAPLCEPVHEKAYRFGKIVLEICDLLLHAAWDDQCGGFYTSLSEQLEPMDCRKKFETQMRCLLALNVGYRLTGLKRFQQKLAEAVSVIEEKCFDPEYGGVYTCFDRAWIPLEREKECGLNLMSMGILSMVAAVAQDQPVTRNVLCIWVEPNKCFISKGRAAEVMVTVQNQGFETVRVRVGGLSSPSRWMIPGEVVFDLGPHEVYSYQLMIQPPPDMPPGRYSFEIACLPDGEITEYISAQGLVIISDKE